MKRKTRVSRAFFAVLVVIVTSLIGGCFDQQGQAIKYHGIYTTDQANLPLIQIYHQDGQDYLRSAWGVLAIDVSTQGAIKIHDSRVSISGQFTHVQQGEYQQAQFSENGQRYQAKRHHALPQHQLLDKLYDSPEWFTSVGQHQSCQFSSWSENPDAKFNRDLIDELMQLGEKESGPFANTNSFLIAKNGEIVYEKYLNGWQSAYPHSVQSITKSLTSMMVGVAQQQEKLGDTHQKLSELMPQYESLLQGDKASLTLHDFLSMGAGLEWDEWGTPYSDPANIRYQEMVESDPARFVLSRSMVDKPGIRFNYNGGLVTIVGQLLAEQTQYDNFAEFMKSSSLQSLCLEHAYISKQAGNHSNTAGGAFLRSRDMLKLGLLLDNQGKWQGNQIISPSWIKQMTTPYLATPIYSSGYGYYWWIDHIFSGGKTYQVNYALGYGGQMIAVVDDLNLVIVRTASNFELLLPHTRLIKEFILPAFGH